MSTYTKFVLGLCVSSLLGLVFLSGMKGFFPDMYSEFQSVDKFFLMLSILFVGMVVCFIASYAEDLMGENNPFDDLKDV